MVSIIIPVYNAEAYIEDAVRSALASSLRDIEVVCMDDGSTDGSLAVLNRLAADDPRVHVLHEKNSGVCRARNAAIRASHGEYILPLDADNILLPHFLEEAVVILEHEAEVKAVAPKAEFFGERTGIWKLPEFSLREEARHNILDTCALYRRTDFDLTEGYCPDIVAREDWEFWISMLKGGGRVVRTTSVGLRYRYRRGTKRESDRRLKQHVVRTLNRRHPEFFEHWLGGPLRQHRSWSRIINRIGRLFCPRTIHVETAFEPLRDFVASLPERFSSAENGTVIYRGRNELRSFATPVGDVVVKEFCRPHIVNRIVYGTFRKSKAQRSCEYAVRLRTLGIGSPAPIGWCTTRRGLLLSRSYYASLRSALPHTYISLLRGEVPPALREAYLRAVGQTAGRLHNAGIIHRDFSRGNILLGTNADGSVAIELVDLNRLRFHTISMEEGVHNFSRLPMTDAMKRIIAEAYAQERRFPLTECLALWPQTESVESPEAGVRPE
jgi:glycosyltransferase involved in cell wall biosynthesis